MAANGRSPEGRRPFGPSAAEKAFFSACGGIFLNCLRVPENPVFTGPLPNEGRTYTLVPNVCEFPNRKLSKNLVLVALLTSFQALLFQ